MELIQGWENSDKPEESEQSKRNYTGRDSSNKQQAAVSRKPTASYFNPRGFVVKSE